MHPESSFAPDAERLKESKNFFVSQKIKSADGGFAPREFIGAREPARTKQLIDHGKGWTAFDAGDMNERLDEMDEAAV